MRPFNKKIRILAIVNIIFVLSAVFSSGLAHEIPSESPEALQDYCVIDIDVEGNGHVSLDQAGFESEWVQSDSIQSGCYNPIELVARPEGPWKFEEWLGIDGPDRLRPAIMVSAPANVTAGFSPRKLTYIPADEPYYDRSGKLVDTIPVYEPLWKPLEGVDSQSDQSEAPEIAIWYGAPQPFGQPGVAQKWYDVLGMVSDNDADLDSLEYTLNGGDPVSMSYGGDGSEVDGRRLWGPGDFVVDLDVADLNPGSNNVSIIAKDSEDNPTTMDVVVNYTPALDWPLPSDVVWDSAGEQASNLLDVSQIVDGEWEIVEEGVRIKNIGYDRLLDVGGINWTNYEALVPVTVHSYSDDGFGPIEYAPALGLLLHWQGHTDDPKVCDQPKCGWLPIGMANWYEWNTDKSGDAQFKMWVRHNSKESAPGDLMLEPDTPYLWKVQVDNSGGDFGTYRMKVWKKSLPEPVDWLMEKEGTVDSLKQGSLLLLAHHVDVTFGNVKLRPLNSDYDPPIISSVQVEAGSTEATINWKTDEPATSMISYYDIPSNEMTVFTDTLVTNHSVFLENLTPETTYEFNIYAEDESGNLAGPAADSFMTEPPPPETYSLTIQVHGPGTVNVNPLKQEYDSGDLVTLTAVPTWPKWFLAGWSIDAQGKDNPLKLIITKDMIVRATFEKTRFNYLPMITHNN